MNPSTETPMQQGNDNVKIDREPSVHDSVYPIHAIIAHCAAVRSRIEESNATIIDIPV